MRSWSRPLARNAGPGGVGAGVSRRDRSDRELLGVSCGAARAGGGGGLVGLVALVGPAPGPWGSEYPRLLPGASSVSQRFTMFSAANTFGFSVPVFEVVDGSPMFTPGCRHNAICQTVRVVLQLRPSIITEHRC